MHRVSTRLRAAVVAGGVTIAAGFGLATSAPADDAGRIALAPAKIKMVFDPETGPAFEGDSSVEPGQSLKVVNRTNPKQIGPHFFTLVKDPEDVPDTRAENKKCNKFRGICGQLKRAHRISFNPFKIKRKLVKKGLDGWDKGFTQTRKGDSWYTQEKGASKTQAVSATDGSPLYFFCLIHSKEMQGQIQVETLRK